MKLREVLDYADEFGYLTINQAVREIEHQSLQLFSYWTLKSELDELYTECDKYYIKHKTCTIANVRIALKEFEEIVT